MFSLVEAEVFDLVIELHVLGMACLKQAAKCLVHTTSLLHLHQ